MIALSWQIIKIGSQFIWQLNEILVWSDFYTAGSNKKHLYQRLVWFLCWCWFRLHGIGDESTKKLVIKSYGCYMIYLSDQDCSKTEKRTDRQMNTLLQSYIPSSTHLLIPIKIIYLTLLDMSPMLHFKLPFKMNIPPASV